MKNSIFRIIFIFSIILICIISLVVGIYFLLDDNNSFILGTPNNLITNEIEADIPSYEELEASFNDLFNNKITGIESTTNIPKIDTSRDLVYIKYEFKENAENYDLDVSVPTLNINTDIVKQINREIDSIYAKKATEVMKKTEGYTTYNLSYQVYINNDLLSIVIKGNIKEDENPQKVIIKAYNYNLITNQRVTLNELISLKGLDSNDVQRKINQKIATSKENAEALKEIGYQIYERNLDDEMYKIENTENYFLGKDNYLYIIYPYGNNNNTSETDIVIF